MSLIELRNKLTELIDKGYADNTVIVLDTYFQEYLDVNEVIIDVDGDGDIVIMAAFAKE